MDNGGVMRTAGPLEYRFRWSNSWCCLHTSAAGRTSAAAICLSTSHNVHLIHSLLIRIEWTTGNGTFMSSSHWPIYNKLYPGWASNLGHRLHQATVLGFTYVNQIANQSLQLFIWIFAMIILANMSAWDM